LKHAEDKHGERHGQSAKHALAIREIAESKLLIRARHYSQPRCDPPPRQCCKESDFDRVKR
jgi:hypothetical protein